MNGDVNLTMADISCVFCSIIEGLLPAAEIYRDENFLVLLDKYPINVGHTLVIPKSHYDNLRLMPPKEVGRLYSLVAIIAQSVVSGVNADGFNVGQNNGRAANQIIPHVHVHIIPRFDDDSPDGKWPIRRLASYHELLEVAEKIRFFLDTSFIRKQMLNLTTLYYNGENR